MKEYFAAFKWQIGLVFTGMLFLSATYFVLQLSRQTFTFPDSFSYITAAERWYQAFSADETRPAGIAVLNGFPLLFGFSSASVFTWSVIVNAFCWLAAVVMIFEILKAFLRPETAFCFAVFYMFCMGNTIMVFHLLTESVYIFLLCLVVFLLQKYEQAKRFLYLSSAISILILSILVKPSSKILSLVFIVFFAVSLFKNRRKPAAIFIYGSLCLLLFQMGMMYRQYGNFTVSYIDSLAYYNYLGTRADGLKTGEEFKQFDNERSAYFNTLSLPEQKKEAARDFAEQLTTNIANLVKAYGINVFGNSTKGSTAISECRNVNQTAYFEFFRMLFKILSKVEVIWMTILGIVLSGYYLVKRSSGFASLVSIMVLYTIGICGVSSDQGDRFHIVIYPFVIVLFAKYLSDKFLKNAHAQKV